MVILQVALFVTWAGRVCSQGKLSDALDQCFIGVRVLEYFFQCYILICRASSFKENN